MEEYCWHRGSFTCQDCDADDDDDDVDISEGIFQFIKQAWLLQIYIYFFVKAGVLILPHVLWGILLKNKVVAMVTSNSDLLGDLEEAWIEFAQVSETAIREKAMTDEDVDRTNADHVSHRSERAHKAAWALTQNIASMMEVGMQSMYSLVRFTYGRIVYDVVFNALFLLTDFWLLFSCLRYSGTDFFCRPPDNSEDGAADTIVRCMVPMLQILQQLLVLNLLCTGFVLTLLIIHSLWLAYYMGNSNNSKCFLESLPFSRQIINVRWENDRHRKAYKMASIFLMQNFVINHPLSTLHRLVTCLKRKNLIGENGEFVLGEVQAKQQQTSGSVSLLRRRVGELRYDWTGNSLADHEIEKMSPNSTRKPEITDLVTTT